MALVVDKTVKYLNVPDENNFTIQCSKPMSQLSVDDVKSADFWVGFTSFAHNQMGEGNVESGLPQNDPNHCWCWATDDSALYDGDWSTAHWSYPANYSNGIYMRNILVECALAHSQNVSLQNNASARIVMNIEAGEDTKLQDLFISDSSYVTCPYGNENRVTDYRYIKPAVLLIVNEVLYVWIQGFAPFMSGFFCNDTTSQGYRSSQCFSNYAQLSNHFLGLGWTRALETGDMYTDSGTTTSVNFSYTVADVDFNGVTADLNVSLGSANYHKRASLSITDNEDKEIEKWYTAFTGFKFKVDDVWYKPIVEGGIVTGYTDDMTVLSEWDRWDNVSGHNVPVTPPVPPPVEDDSYADMGIGVGTGVGGYTSFAIMTKDDLVDLLADFNANLEDGMSVVNNFICLYKLGPLASSLCSTRVGNIIMSANASTNFVSIRADYNIVTSQKNVITLGSYNVPRMTNTFYDFAPYSTYELFIPCCGWVPLPDTVAGRQITVYLVIDLSSCTCKGICRIGGTTVAEASGVLGVSVPFFSTDSGIKRAADLMAVTQVISGIAQGAVGAGAGAGALVVSGSANALQGLEQLYINGNTNYTAIKGGNGDITAVGNGEYCTLKIAHPKVDEVVNNSRFGHSVGYLCNTVGKIKSFKGLTICANPHVNGIDCTESEKEEIKRLLEEGIIVN